MLPNLDFLSSCVLAVQAFSAVFIGRFEVRGFVAALFAGCELCNLSVARDFLYFDKILLRFVLFVVVT